MFDELIIIIKINKLINVFSRVQSVVQCRNFKLDKMLKRPLENRCLSENIYAECIQRARETAMTIFSDRRTGIRLVDINAFICVNYFIY